MTECVTTKPNLFISHATSDAEFANVLKQEIEKVFAEGLNVFCTSSPGAISVSSDWLGTIEQNLEQARAVIVIVTPVSIERPWLWFEIGASWLRARKAVSAIYPLCAPEIDMAYLPSPLDRLQALSLGKAVDLKLLFGALIKQFGFGRIAAFRASNITKRIPKYKDVKVKDEDMEDRSFYSGEYTGYSDSELEEVLVAEFFRPEHEGWVMRVDDSFFEPNKTIADGKLLHFRKIDRDLKLPPGTAKRLLVRVAARFDLAPSFLEENTVRLHRIAATVERRKGTRSKRMVSDENAHNV